MTGPCTEDGEEDRDDDDVDLEREGSNQVLILEPLQEQRSQHDRQTVAENRLAHVATEAVVGSRLAPCTITNLELENVGA